MRKSAAPLGLVAAQAPAVIRPRGPVVQVEQGKLAGEERGRLRVFKGVPYAAPPVGALRWRPPEALASWDGVRPATAFGAACPQPARAAGGPPLQDEDCLHLNIWTSATRPGEGHPVMVWLHGGGFARGTGGQRRYDGSGFARNGVVLVSLNYRVGPLGFFAHPALTKEAGRGAPLGSYGLMDQIAALQWVQRNIAAFGGDPARVTIFGESAGGHSVLYLLTNPRATGLFHQAIAQSAPGYTQPRTLGDAEEQGVRMAKQAGLGTHPTPAQLRALPPQKLFNSIRDPVPFTDGRFITETPAQAIKGGRDLPVPLIIGTVSDEGSLVHAFPQAVDAAMVVLGNTAHSLRAAYGAQAPDQASFQRQVFADVVFSAPARWIAARHSRRAPSYLFQFDYLPAGYRGTLPGTPHSADVGFVFDTLKFGQIKPNAEDLAMATTMHESWVSFAKTGTPGASWPAYTPDGDETMVFRADGSGPVAGYRSAILDPIAAKLLN